MCLMDLEVNELEIDHRHTALLLIRALWAKHEALSSFSIPVFKARELVSGVVPDLNHLLSR